jgi:hypothetical protein
MNPQNYTHLFLTKVLKINDGGKTTSSTKAVRKTE